MTFTSYLKKFFFIFDIKERKSELFLNGTNEYIITYKYNVNK